MIAPAEHHTTVDDPLAESCRTLLRQLPWRGNGLPDPIGTLGLTSCHSGEGVTTVTAELARTAASFGKHRILLVDFNLVRPAVAEQFAVSDGPGICDVLEDRAAWPDVVQAGDAEGLSVMTAGSIVQRSETVPDAERLPGLIHELRSAFDLVLFDLPAAGAASSVMRIGRLLDGVVLVIEAERVKREVADRAKSQLEFAGARLLGAVVNRRRQHVPDWLYRLL